MSNIKFRCSQVYKLMTEPQLKREKEAGNLSQTAKSYIDILYLKKEHGYEEIVESDYMRKGLECEQDSLELVQKILGGKFRLKNEKLFDNGYLIGTPDIILSDCVEDVKTCWDLKTFHNAELIDQYYCQGQCYMELTGIKRYRLIYCLINTPEKFIINMQRKFYYKFDCDEENEELKKIYKQIERNHNFDHIPDNEKIKVCMFDYDSNYIERLYKKMDQARIFYDEIVL